MDTRREPLLTGGLLAACAALLLTALLPRATVRAIPVEPLGEQVTVVAEGAVRDPGRYTLSWGARVEDLVERAGGLAPDAARELVAWARPLTDGARVVVPRQQSAAGEARVSVNDAPPIRLERLPGIGPALAQRIVAARPFARVDDLLRVRGIGPVTLERLRPHVTL